MFDVIIIGGGPAGMTAGIYGKRSGLTTLLIEEKPLNGGQILNTYEIDNYPGMPKISGMELGQKMKAHGDALDIKVEVDCISEIIPQEKGFLVVGKKTTYETKTVLLAMGARHSKLGVSGEEELGGMGVSYCATCDGAFFKGRKVAVVGGGDVALEDALFLARGCEKVYLIHRRDEFRGAKILQEQVEKNEKIEIVYDTIVTEILGEDMVEAVKLSQVKTGEEHTLEVQGVFVAVGTIPNVEIKGLPKQDEKGYIIAGEDGITSIPGIFVAGDLRTKQLRQVITAAADGANGIASIESYLNRQ